MRVGINEGAIMLSRKPTKVINRVSTKNVSPLAVVSLLTRFLIRVVAVVLVKNDSKISVDLFSQIRNSF